jgi:hypothetical protein
MQQALAQLKALRARLPHLQALQQQVLQQRQTLDACASSSSSADAGRGKVLEGMQEPGSFLVLQQQAVQLRGELQDAFAAAHAAVGGALTVATRAST